MPSGGVGLPRLGSCPRFSRLTPSHCLVPAQYPRPLTKRREVARRARSKYPWPRDGGDERGGAQTPQDMVGAAVFLASRASDYIHGTALTVDGRWMGR